jgi:hypothetical protein
MANIQYRRKRVKYIILGIFKIIQKRHLNSKLKPTQIASRDRDLNPRIKFLSEIRTEKKSKP